MSAHTHLHGCEQTVLDRGRGHSVHASPPLEYVFGVGEKFDARRQRSHAHQSNACQQSHTCACAHKHQKGEPQATCASACTGKHTLVLLPIASALSPAPPDSTQGHGPPRSQRCWSGCWEKPLCKGGDARYKTYLTWFNSGLWIPPSLSQARWSGCGRKRRVPGISGLFHVPHLVQLRVVDTSKPFPLVW
eukprot:991132-Pelagomonas_calceolata.AAC.1